MISNEITRDDTLRHFFLHTVAGFRDTEENLGQIGSRKQEPDCRNHRQRADRTRPIAITRPAGGTASRILGLLAAADRDSGEYAIRGLVVFPDMSDAAYDERRCRPCR
ncbi:hypothetical protein [Streptomyces scopuliridis]|uniref:hypothetical protein n=1 Tax=Streptomyces scopuliridis TaxID=452529 RepID=UPI0036A8DC00